MWPIRRSFSVVSMSASCRRIGNLAIAIEILAQLAILIQQSNSIRRSLRRYLPDHGSERRHLYLAIFQTLEARQLEDWIRSEPTRIFARRTWYLYELLMGQQLNIPDVIPSGYIDLLDPEIHLTGPRRLVRRQRINDNLLGTSAYSPLVRRTDTLKTFMEKALAEEASAIVKSCDPAILARAVHYRFTQQTKSSFAIEGEAPSKDRTERFVAALMKASAFDATSKEAFVQLQNAIVDPRYARKDWRTVQNFISQTLSDYCEDVHFVCPKPGDVPDF
jgi:hypothetical protein